jgi:two-component system, response regulator PdtaR
MGQTVRDSRSVVLVVEDQALVRMNPVDMVEDAGFKAIAASNADEAISILENRNDMRAVFTDVQMPGSMDGLRWAHVVRKRWPPVALVVTSGHHHLQSDDLPAGGRFLRKPYERADLSEALRQMSV